jgi:DNA-binding NarL/FixJ family response regulator
MGEAKLRLLVVDDHQSIAQSLTFVLEAEGLEVTCVVPSSPQEVTIRAAEYLPDIVLLDLDLGAGVGSSVPMIKPLCDSGSLVVMLTGAQDRLQLGTCLEAGAVGIVDKAAPMDAVLAAVKMAAASGSAIDEAERHELLTKLRLQRERDRSRLALFEMLTPKEEAVLMALCDGKSAANYAEEAFISVFTVRGHIRSVLTKLGVGSQLAAVALAHASGWLP